jgi:CRISPR-associated protein Cmr1
MEFKLKALTDIWTGGVEGKPDKLQLTGIKGSIRWWYEVLVRGLDGYACNPTDDSPQYKRCELKLTDEEKKKIKHKKQLIEVVKPKICPVCYMFGCTGWSGKFNLRIKKCTGEKAYITVEPIKANDFFIFEFIPKKEFEPVENLLLTMTLKLIIDYGAIGGKTVLKPSEDKTKNTPKYHKGPIHVDYGLIGRATDNICKEGLDVPADKLYTANKESISSYLAKFSKEDNISAECPDLNYFWFVTNFYIDRVTHNEIVKRDPNNPKKYLGEAEESFHKWLGGDIGKSKKIFSFYSANRCWGYTKREKIMFNRFMKELEGCGIKNVVRGSEVQNVL